VGFNEKRAGKVLTLVKCKAKLTLPSLVLELFPSQMSGKKENTKNKLNFLLYL